MSDAAAIRVHAETVTREAAGLHTAVTQLSWCDVPSWRGHAAAEHRSRLAGALIALASAAGGVDELAAALRVHADAVESSPLEISPGAVLAGLRVAPW